MSKLSHNALANIIQITIGTLLVFILFKVISQSLGVDTLGVWSVILASISTARLTEMGLSSSVTRFVALYSAKGESIHIAEIVATAAITLFALIGILLPVFFLVGIELIQHIFKDGYIRMAEEILPFALVSFLISNIYGVFLAALDGMQFMVLRTYIVLFGQLMYTLIGIFSIPYFDILGLAYAQVAQGMILSTICFFALRTKLKHVSIKKYKFTKKTLSELFSYGAQIQASVFFMSILDPAVKALITLFGGPLSAGYFEISNQIVSRARALITAANQAVVPHIASIDYDKINVIQEFYQKNVAIVGYVSIPIFSMLLLWSSPISILMFGSVDVDFIHIYLILVCGWIGNLASSPSYFINQGTGRVGINTYAIVIMCFVCVVFGILFGYLWGEVGVVVAYTLALSMGAIFLLVEFNKFYNSSIDPEIISNNRNSLYLFFAILLYSVLNSNYVIDIGFQSIVFCLLNILIIYFGTKHPLYSLMILPVLRRRLSDISN